MSWFLCTLSQAVQRVHKPIWSAKKKNERKELEREENILYFNLDQRLVLSTLIIFQYVGTGPEGTTCSGSHTEELQKENSTVWVQVSVNV